MGVRSRDGSLNELAVGNFLTCWSLFIDWCLANSSSKILRSSFSRLAASFLKDRWLDTPGRGEGRLCQSTTRHTWCGHLCGAAAAFFRMDSVFKECKARRKTFITHLIPHWEMLTLQIQRLGALWRGSGVKFWCGEGVWWLGFDKAFPESDRLCWKTSLLDCNPLQICCLADWWLYNTLSRAGEVLRTILRARVSTDGLGLYWQNLANKRGTAVLFRDDAMFASGNSPGTLRYRGSVGICGWHDTQKNDKCAAFSRLNNRFVINLSVPLDHSIAAIGTRRDGTNKRIFEVIRGLGPIDLSGEEIELPPLQNAIFPDVLDPARRSFILNCTKKRIQEIRKDLYKGSISASALLKLSGHVWTHQASHCSVFNSPRKNHVSVSASSYPGYSGKV